MSADLFASYLALPRPSRTGSYSVEQDNGRRCRVGRSHENHPAVLIEFSDQKEGSTPRHLANLTYAPPSSVEVVGTSGQHRNARVAILECRTADQQLAAYFFRIVESVLLDVEETVDGARFEAALDAVVTLFRALQRPGYRTVQGLWTELAVIAWSAQPPLAISSWHSEPRALHDFSAGSARLEVKSTTKSLREHSFLLDQLSSMSPSVTIIASIQLDEKDDGANLYDLIELIRQRLGDDVEPARRVQSVVVESLGQAWNEAEHVRFDLDAARETLRIYRAEDIPTVPQPLPPQVKDVRFVVDISSTPPISFEAARALAPVFAMLLPSS